MKRRSPLRRLTAVPASITGASITNLDFTEARHSEWQWHQLGHMQVCISLQTDNHTSTPPLKIFTGRMPFLPPNLGLPYVQVSPDTSSFLAFVRASGRVFENRRFVPVFGPIRKYIRTLPIAKAYDGMRQRKLVIFQYKMSITSQNAILVGLQASCTCLLNKSKRCAHH